MTATGSRREAALIERGTELGVLADSLTQAVARTGSVVLLEGASGIGKTRLLDETATGAPDGILVLRARGSELECDLAYCAIRQLLEPALLGLSEREQDELLADAEPARGVVLGASPDTTAIGSRAQIDHALFRLIAGLADQKPLALIVDDAHWIDDPSRRCLAYLARRLGQLPVALIVAATGTSGGPLGEPDADDRVIRVELASLSAAGTGRLIAALTGSAPAASAASACHEAAGGNPLLVRELVLAIEHEARTLTAQAVADLTAHGAESLSRAVRVRLGSLGAEAIAVAAAVAILGSDSRLSNVAALSGLDVETVATAANRLAGASILNDALPLSFAHPLWHAAVERDLTAVQRALLHHRAAAVLRDSGSPPERTAVHLLNADPSCDPETAEILIAAAASATAKAAPESAVRYLRRALTEPPHEWRRSDVLLRLGMAELEAGEPDAEDRLESALDALTAPGPIAEATLGLVDVRRRAGRYEDAITAIDQVADRVLGDHAHRLALERSLLGLCTTAHATDARASLSAGTALGGSTPVEQLALAGAALAVMMDPAAAATGARGLAEEALAGGALLAEHTVDSPYWTIAIGVLAETAVGACDGECALAFDDARSRRSQLGQAAASLALARVALARGELRDAIANADASLKAADACGRNPLPAGIPLPDARFVLVSAQLASGDVDGARRLIGSQSEGETPAERGSLEFLRGQAALESGDAHTARKHFVACGEAFASVGVEPRHLDWRLGAAAAERALGDAEAAIATADEALRRARVWGSPERIGAALRVRGVLADPAPGCDLLSEAVSVLRTSSARLELAGALVDLGMYLNRAGRRRAAREALEEGLDLAARSGAEPVAGRALAQLRVLGSKPRRLMFSGLESLTASERRAAELALTGATNREIAQTLFVTIKTVENHLSSVYRKLDIRRRDELPAALGEGVDAGSGALGGPDSGALSAARS